MVNPFLFISSITSRCNSSIMGISKLAASILANRRVAFQILIVVNRSLSIVVIIQHYTLKRLIKQYKKAALPYIINLTKRAHREACALLERRRSDPQRGLWNTCENLVVPNGAECRSGTCADSAIVKVRRICEALAHVLQWTVKHVVYTSGKLRRP